MSQRQAQGLAKHCSRCGAAFACGIEMSECWCSQLPALEKARLDVSADCLCPSCLQRALDAADPSADAKIGE